MGTRAEPPFLGAAREPPNALRMSRPFDAVRLSGGWPKRPKEHAMDASLRPEVFLGVSAVFCSESMRRLVDVVRRVAQSPATVLITGETGSGKELIARAVHHYSLRCDEPWVDVNCAALPEHLVESELFGYDKGAFSGADSMKPGLFELADKGTLFLDEIADLELKMQTKLLRVLDRVPYYRLGGRRKTSVDVRVVAATNHDLAEAVATGKFRHDLFHRLSEVHLKIPPLRQRPEDVVPLAEFFLRECNPARSFSACRCSTLSKRILGQAMSANFATSSTGQLSFHEDLISSSPIWHCRNRRSPVPFPITYRFVDSTSWSAK